MSFKRIKPILTGNQSGVMSKPSLFRACVNGDRAEYWAVELLIMAAYRRANANHKD